MYVSPQISSFVATYEAGRPQVVWTKLIADLETPVAAMLKLTEGQSYSFLLESIEGGAVRGRYSYIGLNPDVVWRCHGSRAEISRLRHLGGEQRSEERFEPSPLPALESLRALIGECRIDLPIDLPPGSASLIGFFSYDFVRLIERLPDANPDELHLPDAILMRPTVVTVFDNVLDEMTVVTPVYPETGVTAAAAYDRACLRLDDIVAGLERGVARHVPAHAAGPVAEATSNCTRAEYHAMVEQSQEYIRAGDAFQIVPSQRFSMPFALSPFALYRSLRRLNPSPFSFYLHLGDFALVGSSPEILVRLRDDVVTVRPIAGTRRRGATRSEDLALERELLADPKELAEHLMLLDLGRNDVGRVAKVGTVRVTEKMVVERYSHVMHVVSNVEGEFDSQRADVLDALCAGFPAGTVSGAPKIRAMQIIDELEPVRRSFYAGGIGYIGADGNMDTCIGLRTGLVKDGTLYVQAGGGVVADSDPETEYQESCMKARALFSAAEDALLCKTFSIAPREQRKAAE